MLMKRKPHTPNTVSAAHAIRHTLADSPNAAMPAKKLPVAPLARLNGFSGGSEAQEAIGGIGIVVWNGVMSSASRSANTHRRCRACAWLNMLRADGP